MIQSDRATGSQNNVGSSNGASLAYPGKSSNSVEEEYHSDDCAARTRVSSLAVDSRACGPYRECGEHTDSRNKE